MPQPDDFHPHRREAGQAERDAGEGKLPPDRAIGPETATVGGAGALVRFLATVAARAVLARLARRNAPAAATRFIDTASTVQPGGRRPAPA